MLDKQLVGNEGDLIYKINEAGNFVYVNHVTAHVTGYTRDELIGTHFSCLLRDDYKDFATNFYLKQLEKNAPSTYLEFPLVKKDGQHIWLGQNVSIESNKDGMHMSAVAQDITSTLKKEIQLRYQTERHIVVAENVQAAILVEDENRKIVTINTAFCNMFNIPFTLDELIGQNYIVIHEFLRKAAKDPKKFDSTEEVLIDEKIFLIADPFELSNGNCYERDYIPIYGETGYTGCLWKYRDVTEKKRIKNQLLQNERKYKSIIDTMNLGLLEVDNDGYIISGNEAFCEMLSYESIDQLKGKEAFETLLDAESQEIMKEQIALREKGASGAYEIKIKKANGIDFAWVLISGTPLFDDKNNVVGSLGIHLDITKQKTVARELQEAKARESQIEAQEKAMELLEEKVAERTIEVLTQKKIIEDKNHEITLSLNYALRIQQALLPSKKKIRKTLTENFILFKPKDIVSGDFYFYSKKGDRIVIAAADCTGHGVPGAFMSMLGSEKLLNAVQKGVPPGETLSLLDRSIKNSLHHSENERSILDGLDISLCAIDLSNKIIQFAGAHRPIWIIRNSTGQLEEIKGANRDIGGWTDETAFFETHEAQLEKGDTFYLFTDGFADQFGDNNKRLMTKRFKQELLSIQHLSMHEQEIFLDAFFKSWQGSQEQTDDILVIGVRL